MGPAARRSQTWSGPAIEEIVRLNTPIRVFSRYVEEDTDLAGVRLAARIARACGLRGGQPGPAEVRRSLSGSTSPVNPRGHVGFGHGVHACMGMHLARLEIRSLLLALARRVERFELNGPVRTVTNATIHAFASVPVRAHVIDC